MMEHVIGKKKFLMILWDKDKVSFVKIKMEPRLKNRGSPTYFKIKILFPVGISSVTIISKFGF